jgi:WbqC-like protein family
MANRALCAIHQPNFFPRLSTLAKLFAATTWVVLDDVQFARRDYQHRARLRTLGAAAEPREQWMTLPVHLPNGRDTAIRNVTLADSMATRDKLGRMLEHTYTRSPYWAAVHDSVQPVLATMEYRERLAPLAELSTLTLLRLVGWTGQIQRSSDFAVRDGRNERLVDLTTATNAPVYLCGTGGARYLTQSDFTQRGINVEYFDVPSPSRHPIWAGARRVSALHAIALWGPEALATELRATSARGRIAQAA